jgi:hypothetical protein
MRDEQAPPLQKRLQSSTMRMPIVLLQRVEEIIPAVRENLVSVVSRREFYHVIVWIYMAKRRNSFQGSLC